MSYKIISPISVVEGGTGAQTFTANGVILGNGISPLVATAAGTTGQVLTGVTSGAPTFQSPAASSISITGNTGGALTGNSFTFSGGTTGLSFGGSGTTETLSGTLIVGNGGTNATSFTQSNGIVTYNGTSLVNYAGPQINSSGQMTNTSQPAFLAYLNSSQSNVTGDATNYTVPFNTKLYDNGSNFNTSTFTFTAPVTGVYCFNTVIYIEGLAVANTIVGLYFINPVTNGLILAENPGAVRDANSNLCINGSLHLKLSATQTVSVQVTVYNSTKTITILGGTPATTGAITLFSGFLVC